MITSSCLVWYENSQIQSPSRPNVHEFFALAQAFTSIYVDSANQMLDALPAGNDLEYKRVAKLVAMVCPHISNKTKQDLTSNSSHS